MRETNDCTKCSASFPYHENRMGYLSLCTRSGVDLTSLGRVCFDCDLAWRELLEKTPAWQEFRKNEARVESALTVFLGSSKPDRMTSMLEKGFADRDRLAIVIRKVAREWMQSEEAA